MPGTKTIGLLVASAMLMGWPASPVGAQAPAPANVQIVHRTGQVNPDWLVNTSKTDRAVATVVVALPSEVLMSDFGDNSFRLRTSTTQIVLLFPGQEIQLPSGIPYGGGLWPISYAIVGSYVPRPDLMDLPAGRAQDQVRIRQNGMAPPGACPLGQAFGLTARNNSIWRSVAVTYRNKTPGRRTTPQTLYLGPGEDGPVGCSNEWDNIEFIGAEFVR